MIKNILLCIHYCLEEKGMEGEKEIDPKMVELKKQLNTEDGGKYHILNFFVFNEILSMSL